jgi:carbon-monoxide dehydrogenase large subunit
MRLAGALLVKAAAEIIERGKNVAVRLLEAAAADVVFSEGRYRVAGTDREIGLLEVARRTPLDARCDFFGRMPAHPAGTAVCELESDPDTGTVRIVRYICVDDVGQPINPMIVAGQTHGGAAQGIGQALHEDVAYDDSSGQIRAGSFMDYTLPRADELPAFEVTHLEDPTPGNPLRVKGAGEGGTIPATAAVMNALCDALGVDDLPMPATPEKVWRASRRTNGPGAKTGSRRSG